MRKKIKNLLIWALLLDAAFVFYLQINQMNAWIFICLYWAILTVKNSLDVADIKY